MFLLSFKYYSKTHALIPTLLVLILEHSESRNPSADAMTTIGTVRPGISVLIPRREERIFSEPTQPPVLCVLAEQNGRYLELTTHFEQVPGL